MSCQPMFVGAIQVDQDRYAQSVTTVLHTRVGRFAGTNTILAVLKKSTFLSMDIHQTPVEIRFRKAFKPASSTLSGKFAIF